VKAAHVARAQLNLAFIVAAYSKRIDALELYVVGRSVGLLDFDEETSHLPSPSLSIGTRG
jgi:hypothetical protein